MGSAMHYSWHVHPQRPVTDYSVNGCCKGVNVRRVPLDIDVRARIFVCGDLLYRVGTLL